MKKSGTSLEKTTTWMSGSASSPATMSCNVTMVSGITRFAGGFANVILAVRGVVRSRRMVLGWLIRWLRFAGGLGRVESDDRGVVVSGCDAAGAALGVYGSRLGSMHRRG